MPICSICDWDVSKSQWKNHKTNCYNEYRQKVVAIHSTPSSKFDVDDQQQLNDDYDMNEYDYDYDYGDTFQNDNLYGLDDHNYIYNTQDATDESEDEKDGDIYDTLSQVSEVDSSQIELENPSTTSTTTVPAQKFMIKTSSVSVTKTLKRSIRLYVEVKAKNITRELYRAFVKFYNESMIEEGLRCVMFKNDEDVCSVCGEARFITTPNGIKKSRNTMLYISLKEQLAIILARPTTRKMLMDLSQRTSCQVPMSDIFDGSAWRNQKYLFTRPYDIALSLFVDGFKPFKHTKISLTMTHIIVLSFSPFERYLEQNTLQVTILPCAAKYKNIFNLLQPLLDDLEDLQTIGMDVIGTDGKEIKATAHLLLASGDIPGIAALYNHTGHNSYYGCHTCNIRTDRLQSSTGVGSAQYFAGTFEPNYSERNRTQFEKGAPTEGIRGPTPFAFLKTFHSPYFWGKDEMHLFGGNVID
ncbi:hypothetical protein INT45_013615 [Circinella minor]|uniref:Transposase domain-containing protein n=1 Tax=Circinella minor TaxID=1195481 RepID=A0A8H7VB79_9FUNG|nr:hypothetical protein INT45_013615 [Circinella minor]